MINTQQLDASAALKDEQYFSLTTFRKNGNPVAKIHISTNYPSINLLLFSLLLWVLSYVFLQGVKLKEENELTV